MTEDNEAAGLPIVSLQNQTMIFGDHSSGELASQLHPSPNAQINASVTYRKSSDRSSGIAGSHLLFKDALDNKNSQMKSSNIGGGGNGSEFLVIPD
jgi:hypothetical protein